MEVKINDGNMKVIGRGLLLLLTIIVVGVMAAETQLNNLTKRSDFVQFLNVRRTFDSYCFYVFGSSYKLSAMKYLGGLSNTDTDITYQTDDKKFVIPTKMAIEADAVWQWAVLERQHVVSELQNQKKVMYYYSEKLRSYLHDIVYKIKIWQKELMYEINWNFK